MIKPLRYPRERVFYENSLFLGGFFERTIYYAPLFRYPYHIFILKDGVQCEKHYRKTFSAALKTLKAKRPALNINVWLIDSDS